MIYSETFESGNSLRLVIAIPTKGCRWVRKGYPCSHCPVPEILIKHKAAKNIISSVGEEIFKYSDCDIDTVCLYSPGSLLDKLEIDENDLKEVVRSIVRVIRPNKILLETRPELIGRKELFILQRLMDLVPIEVIFQ